MKSISRRVGSSTVDAFATIDPSVLIAGLRRSRRGRIERRADNEDAGGNRPRIA
jgi:hypothetical protein